MEEGILVNMMRMLMSLAMLSTASVSSTVLSDTGAFVSDEAALVRMEAKWANADRITFVDDYSLFNSGVAKLQVGKPVTVYATINYSGDVDPILQSVVTFDNVDPTLAIDYDGMLIFNGKQATFSFTVTLLESIQGPKLFTVRVSDGQPGDNQYLTPYSQRQTVIEDAVFKDSSIEFSSESEVEESTESSEEPKLDSSTTSSEEPPLESSSEPIEGLEGSTGSSEDPSIGSSQSGSEESKTGSSTTSEELKNDTDLSSGSSETREKNEGSTSSSKENTKEQGSSEQTGVSESVSNTSRGQTVSSNQKKNMFPTTGENTQNRLFSIGVLVTATLLLLILYVSDREKR